MSGKIVITCDCTVVTGLHIGGTSGFSAIGAVDSPVVRDPRSGQPMLPGSSLKGKLRSLLTRSECRDITQMPAFGKESEGICRLFGTAQPVHFARLQFSDCFIKNAEEFREIGLTEVKTENGINRMNSVANPRQIERVVRGVCFGVRMVYNAEDPAQVKEDIALLAKGLKLLQIDYLGGHGSRGSGRVRFDKFCCKGIDVEQAELDTLQEILEGAENYEPLSH